MLFYNVIIEQIDLFVNQNFNTAYPYTLSRHGAKAPNGNVERQRSGQCQALLGTKGAYVTPP